MRDNRDNRVSVYLPQIRAYDEEKRGPLLRPARLAAARCRATAKQILPNSVQELQEAKLRVLTAIIGRLSPLPAVRRSMMTIAGRHSGVPRLSTHRPARCPLRCCGWSSSGQRHLWTLASSNVIVV
jgi:hypothetical protein